MPQGLLPKSQDDRIFSHFTNAEGVTGITGIDAKNMKIDEQVLVDERRFGLGKKLFSQ